MKGMEERRLITCKLYVNIINILSGNNPVNIISYRRHAVNCILGLTSKETQLLWNETDYVIDIWICIDRYTVASGHHIID